jgi:YidC/Oxa1 family membrane protein insertase
MEETAHNQRLLLAAVLSFAVLLGWYLIFPPKPPPKARVDAPAVATATASEPAPVAQTATTAVRVVQIAQAPEVFEFEGSVPGAEEGQAVPFRLAITNVGGGIERFELPSYRERDTSNQATQQGISLADPSSEKDDLEGQMAGIELVGDSSFRLPKKPVYAVVERAPSRVRYRWVNEDGVEIEREYQLQNNSFQIEMAVTVRNGSAREQRHQLAMSSALVMQEAMESGSFAFMPAPDHLDALCFSDGKVQREGQKALVKESEEHKEGVRWAAMDRQYFLAAIVPRDKVEATCKLSAQGKRAKATILLPEVVLRPGEEHRHKFTAYLGVKQPELLTQVDAELEAAVDYTVLGMNLALLCEGLLAILALIHRLTGSWGVAILGLTVIVKAVLFPLNQRSGRSMRAMAKIKPDMDRIREKFGEDRQRQSEEMARLFKTHGVNPASGCLPILLQMPIWFALYRALWVSVDLYQEAFLWMPDLTARDPYWILPVALVAVMFIQQKMTPTTMDPAQQKVMLYMMPLMFGAMMAALPAGLAFYILVNSLLTIVQQHFINKSVGPVEGSPSAREAAA